MSESKARAHEARAGRRKRLALVAGLSGAAISAIAVAVVNPAAEYFTNKTLSRLDSPQVLVAKQIWPSVEGCDSRTVVGIDDESTPAVTWRDDPSGMPDNEGYGHARDKWIEEGGGPIGVGFLTLWLTASDVNPLYITGIHVDVFEETDLPARWAVPVDGQCGGDDYERNFFLDFGLGTPHLVDMGVPGDSVEGEDRVPVEGFGESFTISQEMPSRIQVTASSCSQTVRWGLLIDYFSGGRERTLAVGDQEHPFVIYAGNSDAVMLNSPGPAGVLASDICYDKDTIDSMWDGDYLPS